MDQFGIKKDDTKQFFRPQNKQDVKYRKIQKVTFADRLQQILPNDCSLCFHGTTIWNTKHIIESGNISAEIDRNINNKEVLNTPGQIYVSTVNNLWFTVKQFADLANYNYPAGSIFVINVDNKQELDSAISKNLINNIDFRKQPKRLKAIITTPENIDTIKKWIQESNLKVSTSVVCDYENFIQLMLEKYNKFDLRK